MQGIAGIVRAPPSRGPTRARSTGLRVECVNCSHVSRRPRNYEVQVQVGREVGPAAGRWGGSAVGRSVGVSVRGAGGRAFGRSAGRQVAGRSDTRSGGRADGVGRAGVATVAGAQLARASGKRVLNNGGSNTSFSRHISDARSVGVARAMEVADTCNCDASIVEEHLQKTPAAPDEGTPTKKDTTAAMGADSCSEALVVFRQPYTWAHCSLGLRARRWQFVWAGGRAGVWALVAVAFLRTLTCANALVRLSSSDPLADVNRGCAHAAHIRRRSVVD